MKFDENLRGKRIIITGGAGFIGHNLALALKNNDAVPYVLDGLQVNNLGFYASGYNDNPRNHLYIEFINERLRLLREANISLNVVDIRDYHLVCTLLDTIQPDVIIHLAAIAHANRSNKDPFSTFDHSLRTLENVLDAARGSEAHVVYFSSSMVYGNFDGKVVTEDSHCEPMGIYGALKYGAEKLVIGYNQVFGVPYTIVRPSALYGERCVSGRVGQTYIENAINGQNLTVNGDGSDTLDFTYIEDLIQGVIRILVTPGARNQVFNITYGGARSLVELANIVLEAYPDIQLNFSPRDELMPERGTLSTEKAKKILGYEPRFPLETGFRKYMSWYKEFSSTFPRLFESH